MMVDQLVDECAASACQELKLCECELQTVPQSLQDPRLHQLLSLNLSRNQLEDLQDGHGLGSLTHLRTLDLSRNRIQKLGPWIGDLQQLTNLNMMCNELVTLPEQIGELRSLVSLGLKSNKLNALPASIGQLENLVHLFLTDNHLRTLPSTVSKMRSLRKIQGSHNRWTDLPEGMAHMESLEFMRLANSNLEKYPAALNAPNLSWVALAGNPITRSIAPTKSTVPSTSAEQLEGLCALGGGTSSGASGDLKQGVYQGEKVIVKYFQEHVSPDGTPEDELAVACQIGHPCATGAIASLKQPIGYVMKPSPGAPLGEPHSFTSVLRGRYPDDMVVSPDWVLSVFQKLASALAHMHEKGIAHGDVFAHNMLVTAEGAAAICDFGASFFYQKSLIDMERKEVRAFGILIQDMHSLVSREADSKATDLVGEKVARILLASQECLQEESKRPSFLELSMSLL
eukprot:TRINITY_DN49726_c0_g1_i1.p1 TRINITY_DN49726_c0_g1~~TRINITY_DN49726_c0_g1_i1.p1  ORF type:complete len:456 (-),score=77.57 TRINITY_DN49726_c0_g1_i1:92-1459(-)